jgi:predicted Zn-dependent peptidase
VARRAFAGLHEAGDMSYETARYTGGEHRENQDLEQVHLAIGFPGVSFADPEYYASMTLATLLGGGMSSRLFQEIREARGLAYGVSAYAAPYLDGGVFGIYAGTGERETSELVQVLFEQLAAVRAPVPADELQRARTQMRAGILMSLESTGARMEALGSHMLIYGRPIPVEEMVRKIDAVTATDVARVARRIFSGRPTVAAMGPLSGLAVWAIGRKTGLISGRLVRGRPAGPQIPARGEAPCKPGQRRSAAASARSGDSRRSLYLSL